jgi:hypothetical protein
MICDIADILYMIYLYIYIYLYDILGSEIHESCSNLWWVPFESFFKDLHVFFPTKRDGTCSQFPVQVGEIEPKLQLGAGSIIAPYVSVSGN